MQLLKLPRLDDIEDSSPLRRGMPATHKVFGQAQTINSANYLIIRVLDEVRQLNGIRCMDAFIEEMQNLFIGQSFDLYWTRNGVCPSEAEYLEMINKSRLPDFMVGMCDAYNSQKPVDYFG
jgi:geranylgeranyl pyrophosphate synthase